MIARKFKGDRSDAENTCLLNFQKKTGITEYLNTGERQVLREMALWTEALNIQDKDKLEIAVKMIVTKPVDLYNYQELLLTFLQ